MVATALEQAGVSAKDISRIAVSTGPGSFTGLRVALAFGRSFALPRKIPVIGISALRSMAAQADPAHERSIISAINAKRGDICWSHYVNGAEINPPQTQPLELAKTTIDALSFDQIVGDANELLGFEASPIDHASGAILGWVCDDLNPSEFLPEPFYARGPDAKLPSGKSP